MAAAARDDAAPVIGILAEGLALERVDFVTDEAGDGQDYRYFEFLYNDIRFEIAQVSRFSTGLYPLPGCQGLVTP